MKFVNQAGTRFEQLGENIAIEALGVSKTFRFRKAGAQKSFRDWVESGFGLGQDKNRVVALDNVSVTVHKGEALGVIGANGSGKSTLMRVLGGVMQTDTGLVRRVAQPHALLDLSSGMHPDLSGRENIEIAGVLAGLLRSEVRNRTEEIIEFSELEDFIDEPVRSYSAGMKLRLGFSVAVHVEPQILLIDEVLSVGDVAFQRKCLRKAEAFLKQGCAIVLVSHDLNQIRTICDQAIWIHKGGVQDLGETQNVVNAYETAFADPAQLELEDQEDSPGSTVNITLSTESAQDSDEYSTEEPQRIIDFSLRDPDGWVVDNIKTGSAIEAIYKFNLTTALSPGSAHISLTISDINGAPVFDTNTEISKFNVEELRNGSEVSIKIERLDLSPGSYTVSVGLWSRDWKEAYDAHLNAYALNITGECQTKGIILPPHRWSNRSPAPRLSEMKMDNRH